MSVQPVSDHHAVYKSPIAPLGIKMDGDKLVAIDWLFPPVKESIPRGKAVKRIMRVLDAYFTSPEKVPDFEFLLTGTEFQRRVWLAMKAIPAGEVISYGRLAEKLKTSSRAVGQACRSNPIPILIPCHRVVAKNGLGGYMGKKRELELKTWLLEHEGVKWEAIINH